MFFHFRLENETSHLQAIFLSTPSFLFPFTNFWNQNKSRINLATGRTAVNFCSFMLSNDDVETLYITDRLCGVQRLPLMVKTSCSIDSHWNVDISGGIREIRLQMMVYIEARDANMGHVVYDCTRRCWYRSTEQGERPPVRILWQGGSLDPVCALDATGCHPLCCWGFLDEKRITEVCFLHCRPVRAEHRLSLQASPCVAVTACRGCMHLPCRGLERWRTQNCFVGDWQRSGLYGVRSPEIVQVKWVLKWIWPCVMM